MKTKTKRAELETLGSVSNGAEEIIQTGGEALVRLGVAGTGSVGFGRLWFGGAGLGLAWYG